MPSIGHNLSTEIDSIGDIVTRDLQTCWKCQEGTYAQVQNRQFYRICVSQTRWLDSDGGPRWPHRVMYACQSETGVDYWEGEWYIIVKTHIARQQQSNSLSQLRPFYYGQWWWCCTRKDVQMDVRDSDEMVQTGSPKGEVEYISAHQCQESLQCRFTQCVMHIAKWQKDWDHYQQQKTHHINKTWRFMIYISFKTSCLCST